MYYFEYLNNKEILTTGIAIPGYKCATFDIISIFLFKKI